jgi:hypothetical protein
MYTQPWQEDDIRDIAKALQEKWGTPYCNSGQGLIVLSLLAIAVRLDYLARVVTPPEW